MSPQAKAASKGSTADGAPPQALLDLLAARGPSGYESAPAAVWREAAHPRQQHGVVDARVLLQAAVAHERLDGHHAARDESVQRVDRPECCDGRRGEAPPDDGRPLRDPALFRAEPAEAAREQRLDRARYGVERLCAAFLDVRQQLLDVQGIALGELHIDIGARDGAQAREQVRVGDVAVIDALPAQLQNGRLTARALDNRVGAFVALESARLVAAQGGAPWELVAVAAAQEETTLGGARTSAFALEPAAAIVVDVTHATDAPGIEVKEVGKHELGSGPVLKRGSTFDQRLFELLAQTAEAEGIAFTIEASGRASGTDADAVQLSRGGVPTALVSVPLRYMHSPVELVQLEDVHACARLIAAAALRLEAQTLLSP